MLLTPGMKNGASQIDLEAQPLTTSDWPLKVADENIEEENSLSQSQVGYWYM